MAAIIRMSSDQFIDDFIKKFDYKRFNFLLISTDVKTTKKYKNTFSIPSLIPPPNVVAEFINNGMSEKYVKKYVDYLSTPKVESMITILVKLAVVDNSNVILLCSEQEDEYKYLKVLGDYIEAVYGIKVFKFKDYKKNPKQAEELKNKKKVIKVLEKKLKNVSSKATPNIDKDELKKRLKKLSKKELKGFCKQNTIQYDSDDDKDDIIKTIVKAMC